MDNLLSKRAETVRNWEDFLHKYLSICNSDPYNEKDNPDGYVNLGTAVNNLCMDIICPKLSSNDIWSFDCSMLQYRETHGIMRLREALANVMTECFETPEPVSAENLFCLTGVTSCIDLLAHCLADPGDVFLSPTPMYGRLYTDFMQRARVNIWPIPIITEHDDEEYPQLTMEKITLAYENAVAIKKVVRGIFLINPHNPLGDIYSPELLKDILSFSKEHSLHVIVDEIYALSVYSKTKKFHSMLKFSQPPDPEKTHVLYGLSKDFALAGFRIGVIHTKCEPLQKSLMQLSSFQNIPPLMMNIAAKYLEDLEWCREYLKVNQQRLGEKSDFCVNNLKNIGLKVRDSPAGFFLWVDFRHLCGSSFDEERHFFTYMLEKVHLYIGPGEEFFCAQPGWFRLVFTESPDHLKEGLSRLEKAVKEYKPSKY